MVYEECTRMEKVLFDPGIPGEIFYNGDDLGVSCTDSGTSFKLWSPSADSVTLNLYQDGSEGEAFRRVMMSPAGSGVWSWETEECLHGVYYDYTLMIDGEVTESADPYAKRAGSTGGAAWL